MSFSNKNNDIACNTQCSRYKVEPQVIVYGAATKHQTLFCTFHHQCFAVLFIFNSIATNFYFLRSLQNTRRINDDITAPDCVNADNVESLWI